MAKKTRTIDVLMDMPFGKLLALVVLSTLLVSQVQAGTRFGQVLKTGQVVMSGSAATMSARIQGCDNEELLFTFVESVAPESLFLRRLDAGTPDGSADVTIEITIGEVCANSGQASFNYRNLAVSGTIGRDIDINPMNPVLSLGLTTGASASLKVAYVLNRRTAETGNEDKRFELRADLVSFIAGDVFGQAGRNEVLADINVSDEPPLKEDLILDEEDGGRASASRDAFNDACLDPSADGSVFLDICREVQDVEDEEIAQRIAEAFDAHVIAALIAATGEGVRIQTRNVMWRMLGLRTNEERISLNGVSLAYNGNLIDATWLPMSMSGLSLQDDTDFGSTLLSERWGVFLNGDISLGKRDQRGKEVAFDFDAWGLTAGLDYRFNNGTIAGLALGYSSYQADIAAKGGQVDSNTLMTQAYASYSFTDDIYVDATIGYARSDLDQKRIVDLTGLPGYGLSVARGSSNATQFSTSLAFNYRLPVQLVWDLTAYGQFYYAKNEIDAFAERESPFAVAYPDQSFVTRTYTAGLRGSRAFSFNRGILVPFIDAAFAHESGNDGFVMTPVLVETGARAPLIEISDPDRNYGRLDVGASWVFLSGNQLFFSYGVLLAERDTKLQTLYLGARFEF